MRSDEARTRSYKAPPAQSAAEPTTPQQAQSSPLVESAPFVLEGVITETHYAYGRVNLLEGILIGQWEQGLMTALIGMQPLNPRRTEVCRLCGPGSMKRWMNWQEVKRCS